jgi:hypothetical protein
MRRGDWDQEKVIGISKHYLKNEGAYEPPQDLEKKMEQILNYIARRIFKYSRPVLGGGDGKKGHKKNESHGYDYAYKHYILTVLLNFKHHMGDGFFNFNNYYKTVEKNILMIGHVDYKAAGINEEALDNMIRVYKKRIFEYKKAKGGGGHNA